jgi:ATP phosphoribosyltransferase regulatory subunit
MKEKNTLLLPSGLYDLLPPDARMETDATARLLACFESFGYAQVSPPLLEFETSLLSGRGEALASQTFRVMDPLAQAMMGFRADITLQVARISTARMNASPRPLRLCYAGPILRIKPDPLRSERQLTQAGIELIGTDSLHADVEVMTVAATALMALGITDISIDINLPGLLSELCPEAQGSADLRARIRDAVQRRDAATLGRLPVKNSALLAALIEAAGPVDKTLGLLEKVSSAQTATLARVVSRLKDNCPQIAFTLDPLEYRGFDYHQGIGFSIFARGLRHELGRGGRYRTERDNATGFTLYVTHLLQLLAPQKERKRILVPQDTPADTVGKLRGEGWVTLMSLADNPREEAQLLGCSHLFAQGKAEAL